MKKGNVQEMEYKRLEYMELLKDPDFRTLSFQKQAEAMNGIVTAPTLSKWYRKVPITKKAEWLNMDQVLLDAKTVEVDDSLLKKAKTGDVPAIYAWHKIKRGYSEKHINENLNKNEDALKNLSQEELDEMVLKQAEEIRRKRLEVIDPGESNGRAEGTS